MYDIFMIYIFAGVAVTLEPFYRVGRLLFGSEKAAVDYRDNWHEIVADSHMPTWLAVIITLIVAAFQFTLRILLWPVTVVALYAKYNKD